MKKVVLEKQSGLESGAYIAEDGTIHQYNTVDMASAMDQIKETRDLYHHNNKADIWFLGEVPSELIDFIRIQNKLPNTVEGRTEAERITGVMLKEGQLNDFRIHGA